MPQLKSGVEYLERAQRKAGKDIKELKKKDPRGSQKARSTQHKVENIGKIVELYRSSTQTFLSLDLGLRWENGYSCTFYKNTLCYSGHVSAIVRYLTFYVIFNKHCG